MSGRESESHPDNPPGLAEGPKADEPGRELAVLPDTTGPLEIVEAELVDDEPEAAGPVAELMPAPSPPVSDGYTSDGTPTLDYVRQKIAASLGAAEIFEQSAPAVSEESRQEALRQAAAAKLASLREGLAQRDASDEG